MEYLPTLQRGHHVALPVEMYSHKCDKVAQPVDVGVEVSDIVSDVRLPWVHLLQSLLEHLCYP